MKPTLLIGYGNPDRQDDGVALQVLVSIALRLGRPVHNPPEEAFYPQGNNPDLWFDLQLLPEMVTSVAQYERVCFIDAHTGEVPEEINFISLEPSFQPSILTHHMTPQTFLSLCQAVNNKTPQSVLISVHGYHFGFSRQLSLKTAALVLPAVETIEAWMRPIS